MSNELVRNLKLAIKNCRRHFFGRLFFGAGIPAYCKGPFTGCFQMRMYQYTGKPIVPAKINTSIQTIRSELSIAALLTA